MMFKFKFIVTPINSHVSSGPIYETVEALNSGIAKQILEARWGRGNVTLNLMEQTPV